MNQPPVRTEALPRHDIAGLPDTQDQLYGMVLALSAQLAIVRERLDTVERLAAKAGVFGPGDVDSFTPDADAAQARDAIRQGMIARIFKPVQDAAVRTARALKGETA